MLIFVRWAGHISHLTAPIQGAVAVVAGLPNSGLRLAKAVNMSEHGCVDCTICLHLHCFCVKSFAYLIYKLKQLHTQAVRPTAQQLLSAVHSFVQGWRRKNKTNIDHVLTQSGFLNLDAGTKGQKKVCKTTCQSTVRKISHCRLKISHCRLRISNYQLKISNYRLRISHCRVKFPTVDSKSLTIDSKFPTVESSFPLSTQNLSLSTQNLSLSAQHRLKFWFSR